MAITTAGGQTKPRQIDHVQPASPQSDQAKRLQMRRRYVDARTLDAKNAAKLALGDP